MRNTPLFWTRWALNRAKDKNAPDCSGVFLNRRQSQNDFADEGDSLRTAHFCTPTAYKNALSTRKVFFPTYTPPGKTNLNLFSACGPKMMRGFVYSLKYP